MKFERFIATLFKGVKREVISETVNDSRTGRKFLVKRVKCWKDFVKSIIYVDDSTPDLCSLAWGERIRGGSKEVGGSLLTLIDRKSIYFVLSLFLFF